MFAVSPAFGIEAPAIVFSVTCISSGRSTEFGVPSSGDFDLLQRLKQESIRRLGLVDSSLNSLIVVTDDLCIVRGAGALRAAVGARVRRQLRSATMQISGQLRSPGTPERVAGLCAMWELATVPDQRTDVFKHMALVVPLLKAQDSAVVSLAAVVCWMWCVPRGVACGVPWRHLRRTLVSQLRHTARKGATTVACGSAAACSLSRSAWFG